MAHVTYRNCCRLATYLYPLYHFSSTNNFLSETHRDVFHVSTIDNFSPFLPLGFCPFSPMQWKTVELFESLFSFKYFPCFHMSFLSLLIMCISLLI